MKHLFNISFIFYFSSLLSQYEDSLRFDFYSPSIKLYAIGENHFEDDIQLQVSIIEYIQKNTDVDVFIFEYSKEVGMIFNEYVLTGNKQEEVDEICSLLHKTVSRKTKIILNFLKEYNFSNSNKIEVKGIDMLRFYKLKRQMSSLLLFFPELKQIDVPMVDMYIVKQKVKNFNRTKSAYIVNNLIDDLGKHRGLYSKTLGKRIVDYEYCLNDLKFYYMDYSFRKSDSIREGFMSQNLINIVASNSVSILICGGAHAMFKENDIWYYGYPFTSMVSTAKKEFPNQVYSIVNQYYKKKLFRFFPAFNLLNTPMNIYFVDDSAKYAIIQDKDLENHNNAFERCNMIIIENKQYRKKK